MAIYHYIILSSAVPGREEDFHEWYDNIHMRDVVRVPGVKSAARYRLRTNYDADYNDVKPEWDSLAIYELETDDPKALALHIRSLAGTVAMAMTDTLDKTNMLKILSTFTRETAAPSKS